MLARAQADRLQRSGSVQAAGLGGAKTHEQRGTDFAFSRLQATRRVGRRKTADAARPTDPSYHAQGSKIAAPVRAMSELFRVTTVKPRTIDEGIVLAHVDAAHCNEQTTAAVASTQPGTNRGARVCAELAGCIIELSSESSRRDKNGVVGMRSHAKCHGVETSGAIRSKSGS
jgi:hypothetical protein